ncbi:MAG: hypothetical protein ACTH1Z_05845 [Ancrocorticia sp.]|uniref:hypothetical protein n=1 Tax=Ancrocorticia sp. TaxID=2593684 RepID=UPI003F8F30A2
MEHQAESHLRGNQVTVSQIRAVRDDGEDFLLPDARIGDHTSLELGLGPECRPAV